MAIIIWILFFVIAVKGFHSKRDLTQAVRDTFALLLFHNAAQKPQKGDVWSCKQWDFLFLSEASTEIKWDWVSGGKKVSRSYTNIQYLSLDDISCCDVVFHRICTGRTVTWLLSFCNATSLFTGHNSLRWAIFCFLLVGSSAHQVFFWLVLYILLTSSAV